MYYPSISSEPILDVLRLIRTTNVGPMTFFQLMSRYGTAGAALEALPSIARRGGGKPLVPFSRAQAERELEQTERFGARLVRYGEAGYPALLHMMTDAPPLLSVMGGVDGLRDAGVLAMVGSRNASANACQFAQKIARDVAQAGVRVVSGLARGIDGFAHRGALGHGTIGVIAGGIDNIYPLEHTALYHEIVAQGGAILSEQPFGQAPFAGAFPSRNRIIAGMSHATLVVEASPKSGSLITARLALEYDRELMAVPGSPLDPRAKGCNQLLKQGAHMVEDASDILAILRSTQQSCVMRETASPVFHVAQASESELQVARDIVLTKLSHAGTTVDALVEQCELPVALVQSAVMELELAGRVRRMLGGKIALRWEDLDSALL